MEEQGAVTSGPFLVGNLKTASKIRLVEVGFAVAMETMAQISLLNFILDSIISFLRQMSSDIVTDLTVQILNCRTDFKELGMEKSSMLFEFI
ncbi:hypothetical protein CEXT_670151 [Caerostris extrusa]|uniref:Uncharacterized protein n=1 Tax=Caerostris extrusa TaxID=172846 RepID=A0AAV4WH47_CAEEX|nr:hypothetical protein CEXT_670151 [Caerostris extrusa]